MNVEGDFRYAASGAFDECIDFLEYLDECTNDWEEAFVSWIGVSGRWKKERKMSQNYWGPLNLVKVLISLFYQFFYWWVLNSQSHPPPSP